MAKEIIFLISSLGYTYLFKNLVFLKSDIKVPAACLALKVLSRLSEITNCLEDGMAGIPKSYWLAQSNSIKNTPKSALAAI
jgi:hypothetical protein